MNDLEKIDKLENELNNKYIIFFKNNFPEYYNKMKNNTHHYKFNGTIFKNPYHEEGNILLHTLMVVSEAFKLTKEPDIIVAALLHDIGKPDSMEIIDERQRVRFIGHENLGTILAIEVLDKMTKEFKELNKITILKLINYHTDFQQIILNNKKFENKIINKYKNNIDFFEKLFLLSRSDNQGRICKTEFRSNDDIKNYLINLKKSFNNNNYYKSKINKPKIIFLVGLPGTGKSTITEFFKQKGFKIISRDDEIMKFYLEKKSIFNKNHNDYRLTYDEKRIIKKTDINDYSKAFYMTNRNKDKNKNKNFNEIYEKIENLKKEFYNKKENIVIDMVNASKKSRRRFIASLPSCYEKISITMLISLPENFKRLENRKDKKISKDVSYMFAKIFKIPENDEVDKQIFIETNDTKDKIKEKIIKNLNFNISKLKNKEFNR